MLESVNFKIRVCFKTATPPRTLAPDADPRFGLSGICRPGSVTNSLISPKLNGIKTL